jgi:ATP-dependent RNA helicase DHX36
LNAQHPGILRAVLLAGLYPMVGVLLPPLPSGQKAVVQTTRGEKVRIHPHSANFRLVHYNLNSQRKEFLNRPLLVFDEVTRGEASMSIKNCTLVKPYPLLLLATEMVVAPLDPDEEMDLKMMIKDV